MAKEYIIRATRQEKVQITILADTKEDALEEVKGWYDNEAWEHIESSADYLYDDFQVIKLGEE